MADYDSPWKEVLEAFFERFLAFFFPDAHVLIDWGRQPEFLDKELQQIEREAELGRGVVDKLARVWLKTGQEAWVMVHIEVQSQYEADFAERMYVYNYRLFDKYNTRVISLAVLGDDRPHWRPGSFGYSLGGCTVHFEYPVAKLLEYAADEAALETNPNPFGTVTLAHLKTMQTHSDPQTRRGWKMRLVRNLYERGWSEQDVRRLFRFIDWLMELPRDLEIQFRQEHARIVEERHVPYVTSGERLAKEEGLREGLLRGIEAMLDIKFGVAGQQFLQEIAQITDVERLEAIHQAVRTATSLDEVRRALPQ